MITPGFCASGKHECSKAQAAGMVANACAANISNPN
jgi:hypothetical protein